MENDKALNLCLYDYLTRKKLHATAQIFAQEANISPVEVAMTPPDGLLEDWWSVLWNTYTCQLRNVAPETAGSGITVRITPDLISRLSIEHNNATSVTNTADQNLWRMLSMFYDALLARMSSSSSSSGNLRNYSNTQRRLSAASVTNTPEQNLLQLLSIGYAVQLAQMPRSSSSPVSVRGFINYTARVALMPPPSSSSGNLRNYSNTQQRLNATSVINTPEQNLLRMLSIDYAARLAQMSPSSSSPGSFRDFINYAAGLTLTLPSSSSPGSIRNYSNTQRPRSLTRSDDSQGSTTAEPKSELTSQLQNLARQESETQQSEAAHYVSRKGEKSTKSNRNEKSR